MEKSNNKPEEIDETVSPKDRLPESEKQVWDIMSGNIEESRSLGGHTLANVVIFKELYESNNGNGLEKTKIVENIMAIRDGMHLVLRLEGTGLFILGGKHADEVDDDTRKKTYRTINHVSEFLQFSELIEKSVDLEEKMKARRKSHPPQEQAA